MPKIILVRSGLKLHFLNHHRYLQMQKKKYPEAVIIKRFREKWQVGFG